MTKILVFGDSIAWGAFDDEQAGWVERLKAYFLKHYKEHDNLKGVYNMSVSSNDTRGVLQFLESDINKIKTIEDEDLLLLYSIGSNDCRYTNNKENYFMSEEEFKTNLKQIIITSKKHSQNIIFTGLMKIDEKLTLPWNKNEYWENNDIERFNNIIEEICKQEDIKFIPIMHLITESLLHDGLHPNTKGHEILFEEIKKYLLK